MATKINATVIEISADNVWAGTGKLVDGRIEDCSAQFCDDSDESLEAYEMIEEAIAAGREKVTVDFSDDSRKVITWSITPAA